MAETPRFPLCNRASCGGQNGFGPAVDFASGWRVREPETAVTGILRLGGYSHALQPKRNHRGHPGAHSAMRGEGEWCQEPFLDSTGSLSGIDAIEEGEWCQVACGRARSIIAGGKGGVRANWFLTPFSLSVKKYAPIAVGAGVAAGVIHTIIETAPLWLPALAF